MVADVSSNDCGVGGGGGGSGDGRADTVSPSVTMDRRGGLGRVESFVASCSAGMNYSPLSSTSPSRLASSTTTSSQAQPPSRAKSWRWLGNLKRSLSYGDSSDDDNNNDTSDVDVEAATAAVAAATTTTTTTTIGQSLSIGSASEDTGSQGGGGKRKQLSFSEDDTAALDAVFKNPGTAGEARRMRSVLSELADALTTLMERSCGGDGTLSATLPGISPSLSSSSSFSSSSSSTTSLSPLSSGPEPDRMVELLLEVRDVCTERTDFSMAFVALGGLEVLLGCASERDVIPRDVRSACFTLLTTLALGNVPVQLRLLNEGAVRILASLYFAEFNPPVLSDIRPNKDVVDVNDTVVKKDGGDDGDDDNDNDDDASGTLRARIVQAIDAAVSYHAVAERRFCESERGRLVLQVGMGVPGYEPPSRRRLVDVNVQDGPYDKDTVATTAAGGDSANPAISPPPAALRRRCLLLLRELLVSRHATPDRFAVFESSLRHVATKMTLPRFEEDERVRELALGLVLKLLKQKKSYGGGLIKVKAGAAAAAAKRGEGGGRKGPATYILAMKEELISLGTDRITEIRNMDAVQKEVSGDVENDLWFRIISELRQALA